jgi:hypothetical protein
VLVVALVAAISVAVAMATLTGGSGLGQQAAGQALQSAPTAAPSALATPSPQQAVPAGPTLPPGAYDRRVFAAVSPDSLVTSGATVRQCASCSTGNAVELGSGGVIFRVGAPVDGEYSLGVYYLSNLPAHLWISVNAQSLPGPTSLPPSYDADNPNRAAYVQVHLRAGQNTVALSSADAATSDPVVEKISTQLSQP